MSDFDNLYYITRRATGDGSIITEPDDETSERFYQNTHQLPGRPLMFKNKFHDEMAAESIVETIPDVLFSGGVFMVNDRIYQRIADFGIDDLQFYPAIYQQADGAMHEYNFLIFEGTSGKDWYSRTQSEFMMEPEPDEKPMIDRYSLDPARMQPVPEERRLMFRMTGVLDPSVFVHQTIRAIFAEENATGIRFFKVSEYEDGMEYDE